MNNLCTSAPGPSGYQICSCPDCIEDQINEPYSLEGYEDEVLSSQDLINHTYSDLLEDDRSKS